MSDDSELRRLLWFLLGGTRGGENRARILRSLKERPRNLHQLATTLGLQYNLIQHHIGVLKRNSLVSAAGEHYGMTYFLSPWLEAHFDTFEAVCRELKL
jgi:predicted transcriptional regulator